MNVSLLAGNPPHTFHHTTGLVVLHRLRSWDILSSLYIEDRHNGQLSFPGVTLPSAYQTLASRDEVNFTLALAGIFLTCYILTSLGCFIGLAKSKLTPPKQVPYLGFVINSELQACLSKTKSSFVSSRGHCSSRPVKMSPALRNEIEYWPFLETWDSFLSDLKNTHMSSCSPMHLASLGEVRRTLMPLR